MPGAELAPGQREEQGEGECDGSLGGAGAAEGSQGHPVTDLRLDQAGGGPDGDGTTGENSTEVMKQRHSLGLQKRPLKMPQGNGEGS